jgi:hypothetical protein
MNASHEENLAEFVSVVENLQSADPAERRSLLLAIDGQTKQSIVDRFRRRHGSSDTDISGTHLSPDKLLGALNNPVHDEV